MRGKLDRTRRRSRLVVGIMILTLALLAGVALFTFLAYQGAAADLVIESDRQKTFAAATRLKDELSRFSDELVALAHSRAIYQDDAEQQRAALRSARNRLTIFDGGVVLLDTFGRVRASEPERPEILGSDWADRDYFREQLVSLHVHFSNITNDGPGGAPAVVVSVPILGENGEFLGVLAGMFQLGTPHVSTFYASIVRLRIAQGGNTYVLDRGARILYDSGYSRVGALLQLPGEHDGDFQPTAMRARDASSREVIVAYAPVPGTEWTLVTEHDWKVAMSAAQGYARTLLVLLALGMALPAFGVALLVRTQNAEVLERERVEQEQRVAGLIQQRLLPPIVPMLPGWSLGVHHRSVDTPGQDFYDFLLLPDGHLMLSLGHVADEGLIAAHVLSTTRSAIRGAANLRLSPAEVLQYTNYLLCPEMQMDQFVTLLYANLDPSSGRLRYADAGLHQPWLCSDGEDIETQVAGTPLGVSLDIQYEEEEVVLQSGECAVFFSDGFVRAWHEGSEISGLHHLRAAVIEQNGEAQGIAEALAGRLNHSVAKGNPLAEDVTVVVLQRVSAPAGAATAQRKSLVRQPVAYIANLGGS